MEEGSITRRLQKLGDSIYVSLPPPWLRKYGIDKGDTLLLRYNGVVVIAPKVEDVRVEVKRDSVWFHEGTKKLGITKTNVKRLVDNHGTNRTVELIKAGMEKRGFHPAIFFDRIERAVTMLMFEFMEVK